MDNFFDELRLGIFGPRGVRSGESQALHLIRERGVELSRRQGWPTRKNEAWKYSAGSQLFSDISLSGKLELKSSRLQVLCGDPKVKILSLNEALNQGYINGHSLDEESEYFNSLNLAFFDQGFFIQVPEDHVVAQPIRVLVHTDGKHGSHGSESASTQSTDSFLVSFPRFIFRFGKRSKANIIEQYTCTEACGLIASSEYYLQEGADVEVVRLQDESESSTHINHGFFSQEKGSKLTHFLLSQGAKLSRQFFKYRLEAENCYTRILGAYSLTGQQVADHQTQVEFTKGHSSVEQIYKGVLDDHSRCIFNGGINIQRGCEKATSSQISKTLLLSKTAEINAKPSLQIYNDDVKASHGAAITQLSSEELFYLQSRGLSIANAKKMLTRGFLVDLVNELESELAKDLIQGVLKL